MAKAHKNKGHVPCSVRSILQTDYTEARPGVFEFRTLSYLWQWDAETERGENLALADDADGTEWTDLVRVDTLTAAVGFAWGYELGAVKNRHPACVGPSGSEVLEELKRRQTK